MSGVTDNYGLITVEEGESYDEQIFNSNNETIDAQLKLNADALTKLKHAEFTGTAIPYPLSVAEWGVGTLTVDTVSVPGVIHNNTFVAADTSDKIKILETGIYHFMWLLSASSLPPAGEMAIKNVTKNNYVNNDDLANGVSFTAPIQGTAFCSANDIISFYTFNRTGAFSGTSRIKVTKLQG